MSAPPAKGRITRAKEKVMGSAHDTTSTAQYHAQNAAGSVQGAASNAAGSVQNAASSAADSVQGAAQQAAHAKMIAEAKRMVEEARELDAGASSTLTQPKRRIEDVLDAEELEAERPTKLSKKLYTQEQKLAKEKITRGAMVGFAVMAVFG